METEEDRIYLIRKRHQTSRYEPKFQVKQYKDGAIFLNCEDTLVYSITGSEKIEKIPGIIMDKQYSLKDGLRSF